MKTAILAWSVLLAIAAPVFAALGEGEETVSADQAKFRAAKTSVSERGTFRLHEASRGDGSLIREYVNPQGKVFAVSWRGPVMPDLSQLLGSNFAAFHEKLQFKTSRRRIATVQEGDLVVESTGHARGFYGRAYLMSMLPAGVTEAMIQ